MNSIISPVGWRDVPFGGSDKPPGFCSPQLFAGDLANLLRALGLTSIRVAGISMGGVIAQRIALHYPELLGSLMLMSPSSEVGEKTRQGWGKNYYAPCFSCRARPESLIGDRRVAARNDC